MLWVGGIKRLLPPASPPSTSGRTSQPRLLLCQRRCRASDGGALTLVGNPVRHLALTAAGAKGERAQRGVGRHTHQIGAPNKRSQTAKGLRLALSSEACDAYMEQPQLEVAQSDLEEDEEDAWEEVNDMGADDELLEQGGNGGLVQTRCSCSTMCG